MIIESQKVNLLLVDDEEEFLATMARALERRQIETVCASSGMDALRMVNLRDFDVAVIDVKMPGMDGVELFHRLKKTLPELPVIMLTAHGTISQAFETAKEGIFDYIAKPCEVDELAAKVRAAASNRRAERTSHEPSPESSGTVRVLLVDDEPELLTSMGRVLERRGLRVQAVASGEAALEFLANSVIDVVVLDIKMPGIDGIQTLRRIRSDTPDVEVILLTGHPEAENAFEGMKLGAIDYIVKPPDVSELADKIKSAFRARQDKLGQKYEGWLRAIMERNQD